MKNMRKMGILIVFLGILVSINLASALSCGDVITKSVTLTEDLFCSGTAITIDADNIVIDGNGHTIEGDGTGAGIYVFENSGIVIKNLVIRNFENGVYFLDDNLGNEVYDSVLEENQNGIAIIVFGNGNKIHDNEFRGNDRGLFISIFSNGNEVYDNKFIHNSDVAVRIIQSRLNIFWENKFIENEIHVDDFGADNEYDNGVEGNYWDDFDSNSGFPNIYTINENTVDNFPYWFQAKCGDVNADGNLDKKDINYLRDFLFRGGESPIPKWTGDVNGDKTFNILDMVTLINHIVRGKPVLSCRINDKDLNERLKLA